MNIDTWAVVLATALGPIIAVGITLWRSTAEAKYSQRLGVFRTLMATRKVGISPDHVNALNLVEVDFYGCKQVEAAWKNYKNHLNTDSTDVAVWAENKERLLATLLHSMASTLGFNIPAMDIFKGGYAPKGWQFREDQQHAISEYIVDLSLGRKVVPVWIYKDSKEVGDGETKN